MTRGYEIDFGWQLSNAPKSIAPLKQIVMWMVICSFNLAGVWGQDEADPMESVVVILRPAAEPIPALRYRLTVPLEDQIPGNAAVYYLKVTAERQNFFSSERIVEAAELVEMPLEEIRDNETARLLGESTVWLDQLRMATRCDNCDWQIPVRQGPAWEILLSEVPQYRNVIARFLAVRARYQIAQKDFDGALESIAIGLTLAKRISEAPTMVHALMGISIQEMMIEQLLTFVQQPDAPNLYWALQTLPHPLVEIYRGLDFERGMLETSFPVFRKIETTHEYTEQYWRSTAKALYALKLEDAQDPDLPTELSDDILKRAAGRAISVLSREGWERDRIESYAPTQLALLVEYRDYVRRRDDELKMWYLPYPEAIALQEKRASANSNIPPKGDLLDFEHIQRLNVPYRQNRVLRRMEFLKGLEALRMHVAEHQQLPDTLSDLYPLIGPDPSTGKPFLYDKNSATTGRLAEFSLRVEVK